MVLITIGCLRIRHLPVNCLIGEKMKTVWHFTAMVLAIGVLFSGCGEPDSGEQPTSSVGEKKQVDDPTPELPPAVSSVNKDEMADPKPQEPDPAAVALAEYVQRQMEQGVDVDEVDPNGRTTLMIAAFDGHTDVVKLLLDHGAEVDHRDLAGRTALMYASSGQFPGTVQLLLDRGADVNSVDTDEGWSSLMLAAAEGLQPVVEVLLRGGADINATDEDGDKAIDHARQRGQKDIVALLE